MYRCGGAEALTMPADDRHMRALSRTVLLMLLVVLSTASTSVFLWGYAVWVPSPLVLLVSGVALLGLAALMRELRRKWN